MPKTLFQEVLLGRTPYHDQEVFDRLFDRAKFHTHASVYMGDA